MNVGPQLEVSRVGLSADALALVHDLPDEPWMEVHVRWTALGTPMSISSLLPNDTVTLHGDPIGAISAAPDGAGWRATIDFGAPHPDWNEDKPILYEAMSGPEERIDLVARLFAIFGIKDGSAVARTEVTTRRFDEHAVGEYEAVKVGGWDHDLSLNALVQVRTTKDVDIAFLLPRLASLRKAIVGEVELTGRPSRFINHPLLVGASGWFAFGRNTSAREAWVTIREAPSQEAAVATLRTWVVPDGCVDRMVGLLSSDGRNRGVVRWWIAGNEGALSHVDVSVDAKGAVVFVGVDRRDLRENLALFASVLGGRLKPQPA